MRLFPDPRQGIRIFGGDQYHRFTSEIVPPSEPTSYQGLDFGLSAGIRENIQISMIQ